MWRKNCALRLERRKWERWRRKYKRKIRKIRAHTANCFLIAFQYKNNINRLFLSEFSGIFFSPSRVFLPPIIQQTEDWDSFSQQTTQSWHFECLRSIFFHLLLFHILRFAFLVQFRNICCPCVLTNWHLLINNSYFFFGTREKWRNWHWNVATVKLIHE